MHTCSGWWGQFREDIKSVVLAKGVLMERLLASAKQLCEDSRVVTEAAKDDGDDYREFLKDPPTPKYKSRDMKAQRASVEELREMVTFLPVKGSTPPSVACTTRPYNRSIPTYSSWCPRGIRDGRECLRYRIRLNIVG
mmetsp:Transcript_29865/g.54885  ORF Transcript_29865/g.54885 Transcript_29865/m.54885 type:complete len:138 (+) Transcript_29865:1496-1909(+)